MLSNFANTLAVAVVFSAGQVFCGFDGGSKCPQANGGCFMFKPELLGWESWTVLAGYANDLSIPFNSWIILRYIYIFIYMYR
jgi:hypothetical protein